MGCANEKATSGIGPSCFSGRNVHEVYDFHSSLGQGSFGVVNLATHKEHQTQRAIKKISKMQVGDKKLITKEIRIAKAMEHRNIVRLHECYEDDEFCYITMEVCTGGDLYAYIQTATRIAKPLLLSFSMQMLEVVSYLHRRRVCHRDLTPSNFLFADSSKTCLKLTDFGLSRRFQVEPYRTVVGTAGFAAPEITAGGYGPECDAWSVGAILYMLLYRTVPFYGNTIAETAKLARFTKPRHLLVGSDLPATLLDGLLETRPGRRLTVDDALQSAWFQPVQAFPSPHSTI